jgi:membrane dipeptidase
VRTTAARAGSAVVDRRRRLLLRAALPALALGPLAGGSSRAAPATVPIADMHSHYGMIARPMARSGLAEDMRAQGVALVAWAMPSDLRWIRATPNGVEQAREPEPGSLAPFFAEMLGRMRSYVAEAGLKTVLTSADVDACLAGEAGIVLACEGADFLEGRIENLDAAHGQGLRHLQLVHYIHNPIGDFQTRPPEHGGLSEVGKRLVATCNARGILVDLAHSPGASIDQALAISTRPMVFSHGWVDESEGHWQDAYGLQKRRLSLAHARKIAAKGGVIGLWGLGRSRPGPEQTPGKGIWTVGARDTLAYARELAHLVDWIGAEHVAIGSDIEGVGPNWSVNDYSHVRQVIDALQAMKLPASTVEKVAFANYARVLKAALPARR